MICKHMPGLNLILYLRLLDLKHLKKSSFAFV